MVCLLISNFSDCMYDNIYNTNAQTGSAQEALI